MKKNLIYFFVIASAIFCLSCSFDGRQKNCSPDSVKLNIDSKVKECFNLVNQFRTGSEAYYWNSDNSSKTDLVGKLGTLVLDETLCKAAQARANEIVGKFEHTRPNGESSSTVLRDFNISWSRCGENIAAGNSSGSDTFNQWKEADKKYSGQGHRRNMLGDFTKIGIAYAYDPNSVYKYYWAMELVK